MTVAELKQLLQAFDDTLELTVTDGYNNVTYKGDFTINTLVGEDGTTTLDIGVDGCESEYEYTTQLLTKFPERYTLT